MIGNISIDAEVMALHDQISDLNARLEKIADIIENVENRTIAETIVYGPVHLIDVIKEIHKIAKGHGCKFCSHLAHCVCDD